MAFKLGSEKRQIRNSKDTPIFRKNLDDGVLGEAKMDGSVEIDNSVPKGSKLEKTIIAHEKVHAKEIKSGRIAYGKDWVRSEGRWSLHLLPMSKVNRKLIDGAQARHPGGLPGYRRLI